MAMLTAALLGVIGGDLGLNIAFIFGSPDPPQASRHRTEYSGGHPDANRRLPSTLRLIGVPLESKNAADTTQPQHPNVDPDGPNIWVILQGLSAPVVAFFTIVLMCVGHGQLKAIHRQADIAERALISAERAFLFVKRFDTQEERDFQGQLRNTLIGAIWQNSGTTPARHVITHLSLAIRDDDLEADFTFQDQWDGKESRERVPITYPPHGEMATGYKEISLADLTAVARKQKRIFLYGWADYDDVFEGPRHRTEFCVEFQTVGSAKNLAELKFVFQAHGRHNGAEDECFHQPTPYTTPHGAVSFEAGNSLS